MQLFVTTVYLIFTFVMFLESCNIVVSEFGINKVECNVILDEEEEEERGGGG